MPVAFSFYGTFLKPHIYTRSEGVLSSITSQNYGQTDLFQKESLTFIIPKMSIFFYLKVVSIKGIYVLLCIVFFNHLSLRYAFKNHLTSLKTDTHTFTL